MTDVIEREQMQSGAPAWILRVRGGHVIASRRLPYNGRVVYSSEDRAVGTGKRSEYGLSEREVVRRYCERADTDRAFESLIDAVQLVLAAQWNAEAAGETEVGP